MKVVAAISITDSTHSRLPAESLQICHSIRHRWTPHTRSCRGTISRRARGEAYLDRYRRGHPSYRCRRSPLSTLLIQNQTQNLIQSLIRTLVRLIDRFEKAKKVNSI